MLIALMAISSVLTLTSCDDDELNAVQLHSFGPSPVLRGETIKIIGSDLKKVTKVEFPVGVGVTEFDSQDNSEIIVKVPQEAVPGKIKIIYSGGEITSKTLLTFKEPITVESVSPMSVTPGDIVTVKGDYLYNIAEIKFANGASINTENFLTQTRKELTFKVPVNALSGKISFSDGNEWLLEWEEEMNIANASIDGVSSTEVVEGEQLVINGSNLQLVSKVIFPGEIESAFTVSPDGKALTTTVPKEVCSGVVTLELFSGLKLSTAEIKVPTISYTSISPRKDLKVGDNITISGTNLNLVQSIIVPGEIVLDKNGFTVASDGKSISLVIPSGAIDGKFQLIQNKNIQLSTDAISMKKTGNTIWSGSVYLGNWEKNVVLDTDACSKFAAGGTVTIEFANDLSLGWWQLKFSDAKDWSAISSIPASDLNAYQCVDMAKDQNEYTFKLNANDAALLKQTGLAISGCNLTVKSISYKAPGETIWTGNLAMDGGWGANAVIDASACSGIQGGGTLTFKFKEDSSSTYWQIKICDAGSWSVLPGMPADDLNAYGCVDLKAGATSYSFVINDNDAALVRSKGIAMSGCWCTVTEVVYSK